MKLIIVLKIILAVSALSSIALGIYIFSNSDIEQAAALTSLALFLNLLLLVMMLGIFILEKRHKNKEKS